MGQDLPFETAFAETLVPQLPAKPRERGITMVSDYVLGLSAQADLIDSAGYFVDLAKITTGASRILPRDFLARKIALYRQNGIHAFPGGQWLEIAILQGRVSEYFAAAKAIGYEYVEVSDNAVTLSPAQKRAIIRQGIDCGLKVLGEVGKKVSTTEAGAMIDDLENTLSAGVWKVFVEAKELFGEDLNEGLIKAITGAVDYSSLIFELPLSHIQPVEHHEVLGMARWLLKTFGPEVNIANVEPEDAIRVTALRLGIGPDTDYEHGAYYLSLNGDYAKNGKYVWSQS